MKAKYFRTTRSSPKLSEKALGPYKVIVKVGPQSYTLQLPEQFKGVHPVYHISMLEPHFSSSIPGQVASLPPLVEINKDIKYKISEIVDSKLDKRQKCPLLYHVRWTDYEDTDEEYTWVLATELKHTPEAVADFHF